MPRSSAYISDSATGSGSGSSSVTHEDVAAVLDVGDDPLLAALLVAVGVDDRQLAGVAGGLGGVAVVHPAAVGGVEPEAVRLVLGLARSRPTLVMPHGRRVAVGQRRRGGRRRRRRAASWRPGRAPWSWKRYEVTSRKPARRRSSSSEEIRSRRWV